MAKTKEIEFVCVKAQSESNYDSKIRLVVDLASDDMPAFINAIPKEDIVKYLDDVVFEEWAEANGYVKEAP